MKTVLTNDEIMAINQTAEFDSAIGYARAIEAAVLDKFGKPVAWRGMTGHGAVISVNPPAIQPDNWTPLYALKDKP